MHLNTQETENVWNEIKIISQNNVRKQQNKARCRLKYNVKEQIDAPSTTTLENKFIDYTKL